MSHEPTLAGQGPHGMCVCPACGARSPHTPGVPCREARCPHCQAKLIREGSKHHELLLAARKRQAADHLAESPPE